MRLIDADALLAECKEAQKSDPNADGRGWASHFLNAAGEPSTEWYCVEDMIEDAPTVDAVPVVRCGECKHGYKMGAVGVGSTEFYIYCNKPHAGNWPTHKADWYCEDGKRKEDTT